MTDILQKMRDILHAESEAITRIPVNEEYQKAVNIILDRIHRKGGKLITSGVGKAGNIAIIMASTFASTGTPSVNMNPCDAQHGDLGMLQPNDALILISNSGGTKEILDVMDYARELYPGIPVIAITGNADSQLASKADVTLLTAQADEVGPYGLTPTTSVTMMMVIGHVLIDAVTERTDFSRERYAMLHRGGDLGHKLRNTLK